MHLSLDVMQFSNSSPTLNGLMLEMYVVSVFPVKLQQPPYKETVYSQHICYDCSYQC